MTNDDNNVTTTNQQIHYKTDSNDQDVVSDNNNNNTTINTTTTTTSTIQHSVYNSLYTSCYCEENIYLLCKYLLQQDINKQYKYYILFITNPYNSIYIFNQTLGNPVNWDYHVILLQYNTYNKQVYVYDYDTTIMPQPCAFLDYITYTIQYNKQYNVFYNDIYQLPYYRVISDDNYINYFSSNRVHMYNMQTKQYNSPIPTYECIKSINSITDNDLDKYRYITKNDIDNRKVDITSDNVQQYAYGCIVEYNTLVKLFVT